MQLIADKWANKKPVLLDGATGTELNLRGVSTRLPLWSAAALWEAPEVLLQVHRDYVQAGAEIITANTFRTHARNLRAGGIRPELARRWTCRAVELAQEAAAGKACVAGSMAPLEDCYSPELTPDDATLAAEHAEMAGHLAEAGVDLILVETQPTLREARAATTAAMQTGKPVWVSFVCSPQGALLSEENLLQAAQSVLALGPQALLVNCVSAVCGLHLLQILNQATNTIPVGIYANIGQPDPIHGWQQTSAQFPDAYAHFAQSWLQAGASIIGGCCGTTPEHIGLLRNLTTGAS